MMQIRKDNKIINITDIAGNAVNAEAVLSPEKEQQFLLIDRAAKGSIEAAADLAEGYMKGSFGAPPDMAKARKWAKYAAKHGSEKSQRILDELEEMI